LAPANFFLILLILFWNQFFNQDSFGREINQEAINLSLVYSSNWFFIQNLSYFGNLLNLTPLLHLWSLAIEE
jgi:peptidoglycan/LPS O-acetylase OafA/YrhL